MNRERIKELLPIIQAYSEGKTIQYLFRGEWDNDKKFDPFLHPDVDYRIKPENDTKPEPMTTDDFDSYDIVYVRRNPKGIIHMITAFDYPTWITFNNEHYRLEDCLSRGYEWSADRKMWHNFSKI